MCLNALRGKPKVAKKDIICYKLLIQHYCKNDASKTYYTTPFRDYAIGDSQLNGSRPVKAEKFSGMDEPYQSKEEIIFNWKIGGGYIHTYRSLKCAKKGIKEWSFESTDSGNWVNNPVIYKCVIPKGTKYFKGLDDAGIKCYASEEMKITALTFY